jgi:hypothetical protein
VTLLTATEGVPDGFLELPAQIYAGDPCWIPEDPQTVAFLFGERSPFAGVDRLAVCVPGRARAAVFRSTGQQVDGVPCAFFGYFETDGSPEPVAAVLAEIREWAGGAGAQRLYGPINFTTAMPYRVRLDGGPPEAYLDEPYNPPGYAAVLEANGFALARSYASHDFDARDTEALAVNSRGPRAKVAEQGYRYGPLTPEVWRERADEMFVLGNDVFAGNFAFQSLTRAEFDTHFGEGWVRRLHPELSLVIYDPDDRVVSVGFVYPHYAPIAAQGAGAARVPVGALTHADHGAANPTEVVFKTAGVLSTVRKGGLAWAISGETAERAVAAGITKLIMGPMREDNPSLFAVQFGWRAQRVYGLYAATL